MGNGIGSSGVNCPIFAIAFSVSNVIREIPKFPRRVVPFGKDIHPPTSFRWADWESRSRNASGVIYSYPSGGLGNQIISCVAAGILGVYFNKPVDGTFYDYSFFNFTRPTDEQKISQGVWEPILDSLYTTFMSRDDPRAFNCRFVAHDHFYLHSQFGKVLYDYFGEYAMYYIGNHFFTIPMSIRGPIDEQIARIPETVTLIGVHIRYHYAFLWYIPDLSRGREKIINFIKGHWRDKPIQIALATDTIEVATALKEVWPDLIMSGVEGIPDGDFYSAVVDFYFIEKCDELILTFRSTYSMAISALSNKPAYWFGHEWPSVVRFTGSQCGLSAPYLQIPDPYNDKSNEKQHLMDKHEVMLRRYNKYLFI
jgi:hypothetical protein